MFCLCQKYLVSNPIEAKENNKSFDRKAAYDSIQKKLNECKADGGFMKSQFHTSSELFGNLSNITGLAYNRTTKDYSIAIENMNYVFKDRVTNITYLPKNNFTLSVSSIAMSFLRDVEDLENLPELKDLFNKYFEKVRESNSLIKR